MILCFALFAVSAAVPREAQDLVDRSTNRPEAFLERLHNQELGLIRTFQEQKSLNWPMRICSDVGVSKFNWVVICLLFVAVSPRLALRLATFYVLGLALREVLALALHSPRPYWIDRGLAHLGDSSLRRSTFGLPSGHAMMGSGFWFFIAAEVRRRWAWMVAGIIALCVCVSRVYLGAHFISDVLLGVSLAIAYVALYRRAEPAMMKNWNEAPKPKRLLYVAVVAFFFLAAGCAGRWAASGPFPGAWASWAERARSSVPAAMFAGMFFGAGSVLAFSRRAPASRGFLDRRLVGFLITGGTLLALHYLIRPVARQPWNEGVKVAVEFTYRSAEAFALFYFIPWLTAVFSQRRMVLATTFPLVERRNKEEFPLPPQAS